VIWQICSNRPGKKVPQSARLSAGGGCNRYLGNAQIEVTLISKVLPLNNYAITQKMRFLTQGIFKKQDAAILQNKIHLERQQELIIFFSDFQ